MNSHTPILNQFQWSLVCATLFISSVAGVLFWDLDSGLASTSDRSAAGCLPPYQQCYHTDLQVTKTGPTTATVGDTIIYTVRVKNLNRQSSVPFGPANGVVVTDFVPRGLSYDYRESHNNCWQYPKQEAGNHEYEVVCFDWPPNGSINPGQTVEFRLAFLVDGDVCDANVTNRVDAYGWEHDENLGNNIASTNTHLECGGTPGDLVITKTRIEQEDNAERGDRITYKLDIENRGGDVDNVMIKDPIHNYLQYIDADSDSFCDKVGSEVRCTGFSMAANSQTHLELAFDVKDTAACDNYAQNHATIQDIAGNGPIVQSNTVNTLIECAPAGGNLAIEKIYPVQSEPGERLEYTLKVTNHSNQNTGNILIKDPIPVHLQYLDSQSDSFCDLVGPEVQCTGFSIPARHETTLRLVFTVSDDAPCDMDIINWADVRDVDLATPEVRRSNDARTRIICTDPQGGCIQVVKEAVDPSAGSVNPVPTFTFEVDTTDGTLTATNDQYGHAVFDNLDPGSYTVREATPPGDWNLVSVSPDGGQVTVTQDQCVTVRFRNELTAQFEGQLGIQKTDNRVSAEPEDRLTYIITVVNDSPVNVTDLTVIDTLPPEVEFLTASDNGQLTGHEVRWTGVNLPAGGQRFLRIEVRVKEEDDIDSDLDLINTVFIVGGPSAIDITRVLTGGGGGSDDDELECDKRASRTRVKPGEFIEYSLTVHNNSNQDLDDVRVRDSISGPVRIVDDGGGDERGSNGLEWDDENIREDRSEIYRYAVQVDPNAQNGATIRNSARADSDDADSASCSATVIVETDTPPPPTPGNPIVTCQKQADRFESLPNGMVNYKITVQNSGNEAARDLTVSDTFNAGTLNIEDTGGGSLQGNGLKWTGVNLAANGGSRTFNYRIRIAPSMRQGQTISNNVTVQGSNIQPANCSNQVRIIQQGPRTGLFSIGEDSSLLTRLHSTDGSSGFNFSFNFKLLGILAILGGGVFVLKVTLFHELFKPRKAKAKKVSAKKASHKK